MVRHITIITIPAVRTTAVLMAEDIPVAVSTAAEAGIIEVVTNARADNFDFERVRGSKIKTVIHQYFTAQP